MEDLERVINFLGEMNNLKLLLNKIKIFKSMVDERLGFYSNLEKTRKRFGEEVTQILLNEAVRYTLCDENAYISIQSYLMSLPNPKNFMNNVTNIFELNEALIQFFYAFPLDVVHLLNDCTLEELGNHHHYCELPLLEVQEFINMFNQLSSSPEYPYLVTMYDLNDETLVPFASEEEARNLLLQLPPQSYFSKIQLITILRK